MNNPTVPVTVTFLVALGVGYTVIFIVMGSFFNHRYQELVRELRTENRQLHARLGTQVDGGMYARLTPDQPRNRTLEDEQVPHGWFTITGPTEPPFPDAYPEAYIETGHDTYTDNDIDDAPTVTDHMTDHWTDNPTILHPPT